MGTLSTLLILLIPKCPFCFAGYTSAITICGIQPKATNSWEIYLVGFLIIIIFCSLIIRFRGLRTVIALTITLVGAMVIVIGLSQSNLMAYYVGAGILFIGSLTNRKLFSFKGLSVK